VSGFRHIEQCGYCLNNTHNSHLPCAVRPYGVAEGEERCADFEADPLPPVEEPTVVSLSSYSHGNY
jgi:hypothetical protein